MAKHYINNKKLFLEIVAHKERMAEYHKELAIYDACVAKRELIMARRAASKRKLKTKLPRLMRKPDEPRVPDYIGECFLLIASRLSSKPNFARYPFREDMVSDAVENCLRYMHNFNPERSQNPFAYFTQYAHNAFIRRIESEKNYMGLKLKFGLHQVHTGADHSTQQGETYETRTPTWTTYDNVQDFVRDYDEKMIRNRETRSAARLRSRLDTELSELDLLDDAHDEDRDDPVRVDPDDADAAVDYDDDVPELVFDDPDDPDDPKEIE